MSKWTARIPVAFPADQVEAANRLASLIDPDSRGDLTFSLDQQRGGYVYAEIPFMTDFEPLVRGRDAAMWRGLVDAKAGEDEARQIDDEILELLRTTMLYGDECNTLMENENEEMAAPIPVSAPVTVVSKSVLGARKRA
jgi:hypothetical protein